MTDLIAVLGTGKGTWTGVLRLAQSQDFENVFLIVNPWTKENLKLNRPNLHLVTVNSDEKAANIRESIIGQMKGKVKGFQVAVNMDSGTGKEHTAMITAIMKLGLGFRFVVFENDKIEEVSFDLEIPLE